MTHRIRTICLLIAAVAVATLALSGPAQAKHRFHNTGRTGVIACFQEPCGTPIPPPVKEPAPHFPYCFQEPCPPPIH